MYGMRREVKRRGRSQHPSDYATTYEYYLRRIRKSDSVTKVWCRDGFKSRVKILKYHLVEELARYY